MYITGESVLLLLWFDTEINFDTKAHELGGEVSEHVRDSDEIHALGGATRSTLVLRPVNDSRERRCAHRRHERAAQSADVRLRVIGAVHQTVLEQETGTVGNQRVTLHLTETNTTVSLTTLDGLHRKVVDRTSGTHLELVVHHVSQTLVVDNLYKKKQVSDPGVVLASK